MNFILKLKAAAGCFVIGLCLFFGCSKSGVKPSSSALNGKYVLYKSVDTLYDPISNTVSSVLVESLGGDTTYHYNNGQIRVQPNSVPNYSSANIADTLNFQTSTSGTESLRADKYPFTYNLKTGAYYDRLSANGSGFINVLTVLGNGDIKIYSLEQTGNSKLFADGGYYHKL